MTTPRKSTRSPRVAAENAETAASFVPVYRKSIERVAELQKQSLEAASEQNAEVLHACRKALPFLPEGPASYWFGLLGETFERFVDTQKGAIELAVEQSGVVIDLAEERGALAAKFAETGTALLQQVVDFSVATQKKNVDVCADQQKAGYEAAKKQFRFANPFADAFQSGMDLVLETQKSILDIAARPVKHAAA